METLEVVGGGKRLVTIRELSNTPGYACFTEASLRHLIFNSQDRQNSNGEIIPGNGLSEAGAIIRLGRKVLIDLNEFDAWLNNHRSAL